jgi:hypothetical protein
VRVWVPETRFRSCQQLIFVQEIADPVEAADAAGVGLAVFWERASPSGLSQGSGRAVVVRVTLVLGLDRGCVALVDDEDPVEKFPVGRRR